MHKRWTLLGSAHVVTPDVTYSLGGQMAPLSSVTLGSWGTWRRLSMGPSPYSLLLSFSLSLSLTSHKVRQTKIKLPRREFPSLRAHTRSCSGSTSYFHIRGRNCHGVPHWCPIEIPSGQTLPRRMPSRGSEQEKRKRLSRWRSYDRFVEVLVYGNDSLARAHINRECDFRTEGNVLPNATMYAHLSRIGKCTRV